MSSQLRHRSHFSMDFQDMPQPTQLNLCDYIFLIKNKRTELKRIAVDLSQKSIKAEFEKICHGISQVAHNQEPLNKFFIKKSLSPLIGLRKVSEQNSTIESDVVRQLTRLINQCKLILINISKSEEPPNTFYSEEHELNTPLFSLRQQPMRLQQNLDREEFLIDIIRLNEEALSQMEGRLLEFKEGLSKKIEYYINALQESQEAQKSLKLENERLAQQLMLSNITNEHLFEEISKGRKQSQHFSFTIGLLQSTFREQSQRKIKIILSQQSQLKDLEDSVNGYKTQLNEKAIQLGNEKTRSQVAQKENVSIREKLRQMESIIHEITLNSQSQSATLAESGAQNERLRRQLQAVYYQASPTLSNMHKLKAPIQQVPPLGIFSGQRQQEYTGINSQDSHCITLIKTQRKSENLHLQTVEEEDLNKISKNYNVSTSEYEVSPSLDNFQAKLQEHSDEEESFGKQEQSKGLQSCQQSLTQKLSQLKCQYDKMEGLFGSIINRMKGLSEQNLLQFADNISQCKTYGQRLIVADKFVEPLRDHLKVMKEVIQLADHLQRLKQERKSLERAQIVKAIDSERLNDDGSIVQLQQQEIKTDEIQRLDILQLFQLLFKYNVSFVQKYKDFVYKTLQLFAQKGIYHQDEESNESNHIDTIKGKNQTILKEIYQAINKKDSLTDKSPSRCRQFAIIKQQFLKSSSSFIKNLTEYNEHCKRRLKQILEQVKSGDFKIKDLQKAIIALQRQLDDHKQGVQELKSQIIITLDEYTQMARKNLKQYEQPRSKGRKESRVGHIEGDNQLYHWKVVGDDKQKAINQIEYGIVQIQPEELDQILQSSKHAKR